MLAARKRWHLREASDDAVAELVHDLRAHPVTARLLALRGIADAADAERFLGRRLSDLHQPTLMADMPRAAARFAHAIRERERILIHGDYDVDGSTAATLLKLFCRGCSHDAAVWIPHRIDNGYGLGEGSLKAALDHRAQLMLTVDCGTIDQGWAARIQTGSGCDLIVTDHHLPSAAGLPQCFAVVNPNRADCPYPDKGLAGVGVAWKLCWATACELHGSAKLTEQLREFLLDALALVAIGTIADCAPLHDENRILVHHGLRRLPRVDLPGLRALLTHCQLNDPIGTGDIGWKVSPLLNASGRLSSASRNIELLTSADAATATRLLDEAVIENDERRRISQILTEELIAEVDGRPEYAARSALVFAGEGWHPGVVGIVAARLVDRYAKPACVIAVSGGVGKGSMRSVPGVHLGDALAACAGTFLSGGGHAAAAGLSIREDQVADFSRALDAWVSSLHPAGLPQPGLEVDAIASLAELDGGFFQDLERLAPFGIANPEPMLRLDGVAFVGRPGLFGKHGEHIRGALGDGRGGIHELLAWKAKDRFEGLSRPGGRYNLVVKPENNRWRGEVSPRLVLIDGCLMA